MKGLEGLEDRQASPQPGVEAQGRLPAQVALHQALQEDPRAQEEGGNIPHLLQRAVHDCSVPGHPGVEGVLQHGQPHVPHQLLGLDSVVPVVLPLLLEHGLEELLRDVPGEARHSPHDHLQQGGQLLDRKSVV